MICEKGPVENLGGGEQGPCAINYCEKSVYLCHFIQRISGDISVRGFGGFSLYLLKVK